MGRAPGSKSASSSGLIKKGPWTADEDLKLKEHIEQHGACNWRTLPQNAGLQRCGKSCRLRWTNYLRPDIKRGRFSFEEEEAIIQLHSVLGNKWSAIAARLPGRTDNEIKNYWNTNIRKRLLRMGLDPVTHAPRLDHFLGSSSQLNNLSNMLFVLNQQQQQQQMVNPQLLNIVTTLLSINQEQSRLNMSVQVQADNNYVPDTQDLFQTHSSTFLQSNKNGGCNEMLLPALVDDMGTRTSSLGSFSDASNNQHQLVSDSATPFISYNSSPLDSTYTNNALTAEEEIDSFLNFDIPEGFDFNELLY